MIYLLALLGLPLIIGACQRKPEREGTLSEVPFEAGHYLTPEEGIVIEKEIEKKKIKFEETVTADFNGDGLWDSIVTDEIQNSDSKGKMSVVLKFSDGRSVSDYSASSTSLETLVFTSKRPHFPKSLALFDFNRDGCLDFLLRRWNPEGKRLYYGSPSICKGRESSPRQFKPGYFWIRTVDSKGKLATREFKDFRTEPQINVRDQVITAIAFHPGYAAFVSVNGSSLRGIQPKFPTYIEGPNNTPIEYTNNFRIEFYSADKRLLHFFDVVQEVKSRIIREKMGSGLTYICFNAEGWEDGGPISWDTVSFAKFKKSIAGFDASLNEKLGALKKLWGKNPVSQIVVKNSPNSNVEDSFSESPLGKNGIVVISSFAFLVGQVGRFPRPIPFVILHEAAHNLENILIYERRQVPFEKTFDFFQRKKSSVFDFITERNFLGTTVLSEAGHPEENSSELFASTTVAILAGADMFSSALEKWESNHSHDQINALKQDLIRLLTDYQNLVSRYKVTIGMGTIGPLLELVRVWGRPRR